jgi:hypothetical protein
MLEIEEIGDPDALRGSPLEALSEASSADAPEPPG